MLASSAIMAFVPTRDAARARAFFEGVLGLSCLSEDPFATVFDGNGTRLRVVNVAAFEPAPYTVLGWVVTDLARAVTALGERGVGFVRYPGMTQDELGIWTTPAGDRVAWFKDPDGNVLSLSQPA